MPLNRNPYLVNKAIRSFIFASVLTAALQQLIHFVNSIVLGQLVSPDAVSVISLVSPLMMIPLMMTMLFAIGASVVASKAIGERNNEKVGEVFTVSLITAVGASLIFSMAGFLFGGQLARAVCNDPRLLPLLNDYLPLALGLSFVSVLFQSLCLFMGVEGKPALVSYAMIGSMLMIAGLDVLFIRVFNMGIRAVPVATVCTHTIASIWMIVCFRRGNTVYRLRLTSQWTARLKENVENGYPFMLGILVTAVYTLLLNSMVMKWQGADGLFALSITIMLILLANIFCNATKSTFRAIGGMLYGQKDYVGLQFLYRRLMRIVVVASVITMLIGELLAPQIAQLYGCEDPALLSLTVKRLRIFLLMIISFMPILFLPASYQLMGYNKLVVFTIFIVNVLNLIGIALICNLGYASQLWWSFPISSLLGGTVVLLLASRKRRRLSDAVPVSLLPMPREDDARLDISVGCSRESVIQALGEIHAFADKQRLPSDMAYHLDVCTEELLGNIVDHGGITSNHFIDVAINHADDETIVTVKDDGKPFNPVNYRREAQQKANGGTTAPSPESHLGIAIVSGLCQEMDYKYMYGQNMTFLTFKSAKQ